VRARTWWAIGCAVLLTGCTAPAQSGTLTGVPVLRAQVLAVVPHPRDAFTEGLELVDGELYESTGEVGTSRITVSDPATGKVRKRVDVPAVFGEGITVLRDRVWQLTWQNGVAIERDRKTLAELRRVRYEGEGWGLCHQADDTLVMSNGTNTITFRDPVTFGPKGTIEVHAGERPVDRLNELACTPGAIYANVWQTDDIVRIDPGTGAITATIDLSDLPVDRTGADVLNGITPVPGTDEFLVTGKLWPSMFRVRFTTHG
jgi:glutaminyl-peptide cyclotransferase